MRSAPASSGPPPRSSGPASAAMATGLRAGSVPLSGAATSTTLPHSDQPSTPSAPPASAGGAACYRQLADGTPASVNLAFEAAANGGEVLLVDADTYGGAIAPTQTYRDPIRLSAWRWRCDG